VKWAKLKDEDGNVNPYVIVSDTFPAYKIAAYTVCDVRLYRASQSGEFICSPQQSSKEAMEICERHKLING